MKIFIFDPIHCRKILQMRNGSIFKFRIPLIYGLSLAVLLFLLKWLELRILMISHAVGLYSGAIAILFTVLGIWLAKRISKPRVQIIEVEKQVFLDRKVEFFFNEKEQERLGISKRELEVLEKMASGLSNQEIAETLFVSVNTVKTHCAGIFEKLDVNRRTQAIYKAKKLQLIP